MPVSILILTHNEELDLPDCLQSVGWSDDVHVFDSFSSDRTLEIAANHGAQIKQRVFDSHAAQMNAALDTVPFKYPWLLVLNADERVTVGLAAELKLMIDHTGPEMAYRIRRREHLWGRRLKHDPVDPYHVRYFSWDSVRYVGDGRAVALVDGLVGTLEAPFDHFPLAKGVAPWLEKHTARSTVVESTEPQSYTTKKHALLESIPWRAFWQFSKTLLLKRAILDGRAGISHACLMLIHNCIAHVKQQDLQQAEIKSKSYCETRPPQIRIG